MYVDPCGQISTEFKKAVSTLGKNVYFSKTKTQKDSNSCGPISTELAMHFQSQYFFKKDTLLENLQSLSGRSNSNVKNIDLASLLSKDLKHQCSQSHSKKIRAKHAKIAHGAQNESPIDILGCINFLVENRDNHQLQNFIEHLDASHAIKQAITYYEELGLLHASNVDTDTSSNTSQEVHEDLSSTSQSSTSLNPYRPSSNNTTKICFAILGCGAAALSVFAKSKQHTAGENAAAITTATLLCLVLALVAQKIFIDRPNTSLKTNSNQSDVCCSQQQR